MAQGHWNRILQRTSFQQKTGEIGVKPVLTHTFSNSFGKLIVRVCFIYFGGKMSDDDKNM